MYKNLNVELARLGWNIIRLSEETGIKYQTLVTKMKGNSEFKFDECLAIKKAMGSDWKSGGIVGGKPSAEDTGYPQC